MRIGHRTTLSLKGNAFLLGRHVSASDRFGSSWGIARPLSGAAKQQLLGPLEPLRSGATGRSDFRRVVSP